MTDFSAMSALSDFCVPKYKHTSSAGAFSREMDSGGVAGDRLKVFPEASFVGGLRPSPFFSLQVGVVVARVVVAVVRQWAVLYRPMF